jgi:hypothetical protein
MLMQGVAGQVLPGNDGDGIHEDSIDSWHMITHSLPPWTIPTALIAQALGLLLYNIAGKIRCGHSPCLVPLAKVGLLGVSLSVCLVWGAGIGLGQHSNCLHDAFCWHYPLILP